MNSAAPRPAFKAVTSAFAISALVPAVAALLDLSAFERSPTYFPPAAETIFRMLGTAILVDDQTASHAMKIFVASFAIVTIVTALFALTVVHRGGNTAANRSLGISLALGAFGGAGLFIASPFGVPFDWTARVAGALDIVSVVVLLCAGYFAVRFSVAFPEPLSEARIRAFGAVRRREHSLLRATGLAPAADLIDALLAKIRRRDLAAEPQTKREVDASVRTLRWATSTRVARGALLGSAAFYVALVGVTRFGPAQEMAVLLALGIQFVLIVLGGSAYNFLTQQFWTIEGRDRDRILRMFWGIQVTMLLTFVTFYGGIFLMGSDDLVATGALMWGLAFVVIPGGIVGALALAVFYDGALDPSLAIQKTTVYSVLGFLLIFAFGAAETFVERVVIARTPLPEGTSEWVAGGMVAVLFAILKGRFDAGRKSQAVLDEKAP